ncbi:MAG: hypothetical protein ACLVL7_00900 [Anaerotruncus massiliensis (ex Togo et al. 2019)]
MCTRDTGSGSGPLLKGGLDGFAPHNVLNCSCTRCPSGTPTSWRTVCSRVSGRFPACWTRISTSSARWRVGANVATLLKLVPGLARRYLTMTMMKTGGLATIEEVGTFLRQSSSGATTNNLPALHGQPGQRRLRRFHRGGSINAAPMYTRNILGPRCAAMRCR